MRIRTLKQGEEGTFIEEFYCVSEIKETHEKFILKTMEFGRIIEIEKSQLFYFDMDGFLIWKVSKKGDSD